MPRPSYTTALLDDDEVVAFVLSDEVDGCGDAADAGADDQYCCVCMVFVSDSDFGPRFVSGHCCGY